MLTNTTQSCSRSSGPSYSVFRDGNGTNVQANVGLQQIGMAEDIGPGAPSLGEGDNLVIVAPVVGFFADAGTQPYGPVSIPQTHLADLSIDVVVGISLRTTASCSSFAHMSVLSHKQARGRYHGGDE